jgi:hypothetical protein
MLTRSAVTIIAALLPMLAAGQGPTVEQRLQALEARQAELERQLAERDRRIRELEGQVSARAASPPIVPAAPVAAASEPEEDEGTETEEITSEVGGSIEPGKGVVLARSSVGELDFSLFTYVRYLNQKGLDDTYTDAFGRTRELDLRNDVQLQKLTLYFKGWALNPKFRYVTYAWTSNTSMGDGAQVVLAGYLNYLFDPKFNLGVGIGALPTTRSTQGSFPFWLKVDNRTIADDYFRGSYTTGIWAAGALADGLKYKVMLGNNLSQLGVNAVQLDGNFNTVSGALWWMPTTGEYGPGEGFGDFEHHEDLATIFGLRYTRSREDAQSQPGTEDPENSQIRLSDGTGIFQPNAFDTGARITRATYQMTSLDAGMKYRGYSLDAEYYWRWVDDFDVVNGTIPVDDLFDHGFQLQASAMVVPRTLQAYLSGSKIFGEYGDPWDAALGFNWFPYRNQNLRANFQLLYLDESPVGYSSVPFIVGGDGTVISVDLMLRF